jgi:HD-GYP domain-containing protein (c-di-GMP phosphodiesterase class II)
MDIETRRLEALAACQILDTPAEREFDRITTLAARLLEAPVALISFIDHDRQWFKSSFGFPAKETSRDISFCDHTIRGDLPLVVCDAVVDDRFSSNPLVVAPPGIRFYAGVPLRVNGDVAVGALCVIDTKPRELSSSELTTLMDLAEIVADQLETRIKNEVGSQAEAALLDLNHTLELIIKQRTRAYRDSQGEILQRLIRIAEYRDDGTSAHIERMSNYCALIADGLGQSPEDCDLLRHASAMHDIGKIGVPDRILLKTGKLADHELEVIRAHTLIGAAMLCGGATPLIQLAEAIAMSHHEWWDGSGYPQGLRGEQIPLVARIAAIADVFDALTSERPYKLPWTLENALVEVTNLSGTQFDPHLVGVFTQVLPKLLETRRRLNFSELPVAA